MSLANLIFEKATTFSSFEAIKMADRSISYQELNEKALNTAALLVDSGALNNETVGIVGQRKASSYIGLLGILYAGCTYTPISPKYSESRILSILNNSKVRYIVGEKADLEFIEQILLANNGSHFVKLLIQPEGNVPENKKWRSGDSANQMNRIKTPIITNMEELVYILYTSGSTGMPKGVQVSNMNVLAYLEAVSKIWNLQSGFRASQTHDFSFDPSVSDIFFTWTNGGCLCIPLEQDIIMPFDFINKEKLNIWSSVPTLASFMFKMGLLKPNSFPSLVISRFAGEPLQQTLADAWQIAAPFSTVENHYGPTEATVDVSRHIYTPDQKEKKFSYSIIPIGKPLPGNEIIIIDEFNNKLPDGQIGEIVFSGPQITKGYLNDKEKTDSVFVYLNWDQEKALWYKSGDLGFYNSDGLIECLGRKDNQIKIGGKRIEIGEIEATLDKSEILKDSIVVPIRDENNIVTGCVAFTTSKITKEEGEMVREEFNKFLEKIFSPKKILYIESFPLTISGKIDRKALAVMAKELLMPKTKKL